MYRCQENRIMLIIVIDAHVATQCAAGMGIAFGDGSDAWKN
jgi:hypothetical protein